MTSGTGVDLLRMVTSGSGWDFTPPLPAQWARRLRRVQAKHPHGARLELAWTLTGAVAKGTHYRGRDGATVDFATVVPPARESLLLGLISRPDAEGPEIEALVEESVNSFWSDESFKLTGSVRENLLDSGTDAAEKVVKVESRVEEVRRRRQRLFRSRGWAPPAAS